MSLTAEQKSELEEAFALFDKKKGNQQKRFLVCFLKKGKNAVSGRLGVQELGMDVRTGFSVFF